MQYEKKDPIDHILSRPDMYVGSVSFKTGEEYVYENGKLSKREANVSPALRRTFVEILANAVDNADRSPKMTRITVRVARDECEISNDGCTIPIRKNEKEKIYNHSLIFGHLLAGSNFDDSARRHTSGRNGLGAKLTNVFSKEFVVVGVDANEKLKLVQTWRDNMRTTDGPSVSKCAEKKGYTSVRWKPDFARFGISAFTPDVVGCYAKCCLDASVVTGLNVTFNGERLPSKLSEYATLLYPSVVERLVLKSDGNEVYVTPSADGKFEAISFANGILTKNGGKHVEAAVEAVCRPIMAKLDGAVTMRDVKKRFKFLISSRVANPEFDSQEKNALESPAVRLAPLTPAQLAKIVRWPCWVDLKSSIAEKDRNDVTRAVKKSSTIVEGYDKANNAGGPRSSECTLIVCEGLSAKTFAVSGIQHGIYDKKGRDWFGIYPLRGKVLNARNASATAVKNNAVILNLLKILGLDYANPKNLSKLRYGRLCMITDADVDGIHIEALILNFVHCAFPDLLKAGFVVSMKTPILKVLKTGKYYFSEGSIDGTEKVKYYKGLGTTKPEDVEDVFGKKMLEYRVDDETDGYFEIAFDKTKSGERKKWLVENEDRGSSLDDDENRTIAYSVSRLLRHDLVAYFRDDCDRNLPNACDGLKTSQRKILYAAKKRNLTSDVKVAQFGAYVAEHTAYHHGEQNLFNAIIKMAQSFPGTNNVPLLYPEGQFGTRLSGGEDAASPRYVYTRLSDVALSLFRPDDDDLYDVNFDDGQPVEPRYYVPTLPMLLINGCVGIGSGWSCCVPSFSPEDVKRNAARWMKREPLLPMKPWFAGFTGDVVAVDDNRFETRGRYVKRGNSYVIEELPIGLWNDKFKAYCEEHDRVSNVKDKSDPKNVNITITVLDGFDEKEFDRKLVTHVNTNNMVVFNAAGVITRMSVNDIFDEWGTAKLALNEKRKARKLERLKNEISLMEAKIKFIDLVRSGELKLTARADEISRTMVENGVIEYEDKLLNLSVRSLTREKKTELESVAKKLKVERRALANSSAVDAWLADVANF